MVELEESIFHTEIVPRLASALLYLKLRRKPQSWEIRLCEALIFGHLRWVTPPDDVGLQRIYDVASDVEQLVTLYSLDDEPAEPAGP